MIAGAEAALAVLGASESAPGAAVECWPSRESVAPRLRATLEVARDSGKPSVQPAAVGGDGPRAIAHVAVPLNRDGRVVGAAGVSVRGVPLAETKAVAERLSRGVRLLELLIGAQTGAERLANLLALACGLLDHGRLAEAAHALACDLAQRLGCERVAVGLLRGGRMRVVSLSSGVRFGEESEAVRDLRAAMEEATDQDAVIEYPTPAGEPPHAARAHQVLIRSSGAGAACTVPLASRGQPVGAITFEWSRSEQAAVDAVRGRAREAGLLCGPILELMVRAEAGALERTRARLAQWVERCIGDRSLAAGALACVAALLLALAVVPADFRVSARATLEGRVQRALVAPVDGYLAEVHARAGDLVLAGELLARLDDRDLRLEHRKWQSRKAQLEKEYREALAAQDRARVSILRAQLEQNAAELGLAEEQLGRTSVVAPFDGIVLKGDLDRSLGSPLERGGVLFELAPLDGYRIIVEVDGRDIAHVAVGQRGRLALSALPGTALPFAVERITPISTVADGRTYFRAEAVLEEPSEALRPGMEGIAKIDAGRRRLLWIWSHEMLDWLRLRTWSLVP